MEVQEQYHEKWHKVIDAMNDVIEAEFTDEERPVFVIGAQWGEMGKADSDLPVCMVTSNLPVCLVGEALNDMMAYTEAEHARYHGTDIGENGEPMGFPMDAAEVPEEVRQAALELAEKFGLGPEAIKYLQVPNTDDLANPQEALNIPLPGDPTTVEGTDD